MKMDNSQQSFFQDMINACKQAFYFVGFFSLFVNLLMLTVPLYMLQLFSRVLTSYSYATLFYLTLIAIIALGVLALIDAIRSRIMTKINTWLDIKLGPEALSRSADQILQGGNYGTQALRDISQIRQFLGSPSVFTLFDAPWVPIFLLVIYLLHPALGYLALGGAILLFALAILNELITRNLLLEANMLSVTSQRHIDGTMRNAESIQAMGMMDNIVAHWKRNHKPVLQLQEMANNRSGLILSFSKFIRLTLQLLMLGTGAYLVIKGQLTPGAMIAAAILLSRALAPVEQSIGTWKQLVGARHAYARLKEYLLTSPTRVGGLKMPKPKGELQLENVVYRPPASFKPTLAGVSMTVNPGEHCINWAFWCWEIYTSSYYCWCLESKLRRSAPRWC